MKNWMAALAQHYSLARKKHPEQNLMILFDIDGTILDMRYFMLYLLQKCDLEHGTQYFRHLVLEDVDIHENQIHEFMDRLRVPRENQVQFSKWYEKHRWDPMAVMQSHRPFQGVLEVIRWFQMQPKTVVALNTGRPEVLREDTLKSLNTLAKEFRVEFKSDLLYMNPSTWEADITLSKAKGVEHFKKLGYKVFAFIDNEPSNLKSVSEIDANEEVLLLHADTLFESGLHQRPQRSVVGKDYHLSSLIHEEFLPQHIQFVWNGILDAPNLRQFLGSGVHWGKIDIEHDELLRLEGILPQLKKFQKLAMIDFKGGLGLIDGVIDFLEASGSDDQGLWFHLDLAHLGEEGIRVLSAAFPKALYQCPVDFLAPMILTDSEEARKTFQRLTQWGFKRFSMSWSQNQARKVIERMQSWGYEVHIEGVKNLEEFLQAVLLLPRSIASDFNFPQWYYYGHGANLEKTRYEAGPLLIN